MMESERLSYIRTHQKELRVDKYNNLHRSNDQVHTQGSNKGKRIILPSTFVGGRRYMDQLYFDAMEICSFVGFPDLFLTFTCNLNWPEVQRLLRPLHLKAQDHPDIITRIFKIKLDQLMIDLTKNKIFGTIVAYLYTIEFQKRGLPHAHILLFLHSSSKYPTPDDIDKIISAEIPNQDQNKDLYELVKTHMIHGPCGLANTSSPCMKNGKCSRYYPKKFQISTIVDQDGFPVYRRRNNGNEVEKNGIILDNRYVVPYNPQLLLKYQAHINIEWCNQSTSIKYLFKYIHKGYDRITATIIPSQTEDESFVQVIDEIKDYLDYRYISPCEACWRIFSFPIHSRTPAVERLYFHLPNEQSVYFNDYEDIDSLLSRPTVKDSMFTSWMDANKKYSEGKNLTYAQFISKFVYVAKERRWKPRKQGYTIGRLNWIPPSTGELFYLRMMLSVSKGQCSYEDIRIVGNIQYPNFKEACFAMGFLKDDTEYIEAIREAKDWGSGHYLRKLFVMMILSNSINRPGHVWEETWQWLADGILHDQRKMSGIQDLQINDADLKNLTLLKVEELLQLNRKSLKDYPSMPYPQGTITSHIGNKLIYAECDYDKEELSQEFQNLFKCLTGRLCSELAELLKETKLIIWDKAPMAHKFCFEAFDKTLKDIMSNSNNGNSPFGGKVIVFGGDFRQILPVIPRGNRSDIVNATINASYLWQHCHMLTLTKNMRLQNNLSNSNAEELREFSQWILDVGDGKIGESNDGYATIRIPNSFLIMDFHDPIDAIVQSTYPNLVQQYTKEDFL
ncbi:hypothetical protein RJT34_12876 [Clitoria ternatea]|uniref:ATP-dependent DNA helicase n=1 Tax=Clitoria ternatea TaxID=43366 RepID=A0AAN9PLB9_CLITE